VFIPLTVNQSFAAPFMAGNNSIKLFHNDNGFGIAGSGFSVHGGNVQFNANLSFDAPANSVPEPGAWLWVLTAVAAAAWARRRSAERLAARFYRASP